MDKIEHKDLTWLLHNYEENKARLKVLKRNRKEELETATISSIEYDEERVSETNSTGDPVAESAELRRKIERRYDRRIKRESRNIEIVELAIEVLTPRERKMIERYYFQDRSWVDIAIDDDIDVSATHCRRIRNNAIDKMLGVISVEKIGCT